MVILATFHQPESPIIHEQQNTRVVLDKRDLGVGTIYVSERTLCWKKQEGSGFCIEYPHISMHAITTDPTIYPTQCIFIMIDSQIQMPGEIVDAIPNSNRNEDSDSESEPDLSQLVLAPADADSINTIYDALSQCQMLNPDPDDMIDEEEENVYEDAEDYNDDFVTNGRTSNLGAGGDTEVNHLSSQLQSHSIHNNHTHSNGDQNFDDDQFEDAD